jgi:hypothetical protein
MAFRWCVMRQVAEMGDQSARECAIGKIGSFALAVARVTGSKE